MNNLVRINIQLKLLFKDKFSLTMLGGGNSGGIQNDTSSQISNDISDNSQISNEMDDDIPF